MSTRLSPAIIDQTPMLKRRALVHEIKRSLLPSQLQMSASIEAILNKPEYFGEPLSPKDFGDTEDVTVLVSRMMALHTLHATTQSLRERTKCATEMDVTHNELEKLVGKKGKKFIVENLAESIEQRTPILSLLQHYTELYAAMKLHLLGEDSERAISELGTMKKDLEQLFSRSDTQALLKIIHDHVESEVYKALGQPSAGTWLDDKPPAPGQRLH